MILKKLNKYQLLGSLRHLLKLSTVRKVLETFLFLALGSFGSKTVWETVLA